MDQDTEPTETPRLSLRGYLRKSIITGTAIVVPVLITAAVVLFIVNFLSQLLNPVVTPIQMGPRDISPVLSKLIAIVMLFVIIFFVGTFTESRVGGDRLKGGFGRRYGTDPRCQVHLQSAGSDQYDVARR